MAETILFSVAEEILGKLTSLALQQIRLATGVKSELKKLEETLVTIKAVLLDAEEKQTQNNQLSVWLERLRDACYDVNDVLDEFAYEALRQEVVARGGLKTKVRSFFSHSDLKFRFELGNKIKDISERLDEFAAHKAQFHLMVRDEHRYVMQREMTHSFVRPSEIIGRDIDREKIIDQLTKQGIDCNLSVIPIVGIGGLGKTALAKLVYNDERLHPFFQKKMWVCVSNDFSLENVAKDIIKAATGEKCNDLSIDQLQSRLRNILKDKIFLLILDDVWEENPEKWRKLRELLLDNGVNGNKLIVTTRLPLVADIMGTVPAHHLQGLSQTECLSLFAKCAFEEGQEEQHPDLIKIGKEIVKKCRGLPLAVRSLGSMLFKKIDIDEWLRVQNNEIWELEFKEGDILPELRLSYNQLPSYLKKCFSFCSLFPKDFEFNSSELVQIWDAQGFLLGSSKNEDAEVIGYRYIKELLSRSFFQDVNTYFGRVFDFKMHDLVHDLATFVARKECFLVDILVHNNISNPVRQVSFCNSDLSTKDVESFLLGLNKLQTILSPTKDEGTYEFPVEKCIARFKALHCLDLSNSDIEVLPRTIGELKHLRYLHLSGNTRIEKLPNSLCKLLNLRYLHLVGCTNLKELPRDIGNLISLISLRFSTNQMVLHLENGIGELPSLRELYILGCTQLSSWGKGIQSLKAIKTLGIVFCPSLVSLPSSLKYLPELETLVINGCENLNLMEWGDDFQDSGFTSLHYVFLGGLPQLEILPPWLCAANNLFNLKIAHCENLVEIPASQNQASLQKLEIL